MITRQDLWWLDELKPGDRIEVQPYWNETTKTEKLIGPLEVVSIGRTSRSQSGALVSVREEGKEFSICLDAAWFIGPYGCRKVQGEDGWWRSERNEMKTDCGRSIKEAK